MKIRKLLLISSFGLIQSAVSKDYYKKDINDTGIPWRIAVNVKEIYAPYPTLGVYIGTCLSSAFFSSFYIGPSYSKEFEFYNLNFEFRVSCPILHKNIMQKSDYLKTIPILLSICTNFLSVRGGVSVGVSYNSGVFVSAFVNPLINDYIDFEGHHNLYGKSSFFSNTVKTQEVKKWRSDCKQFLSEFKSYYREKVSPSEETDEITLNHIYNYFKENVVIADRYLEGQDYQSLLECGRSIGIIGPTGAGKTYCLDLVRDFCKEKGLDSISLIYTQASGVTPTGYYGSDVEQVIREGIDRNLDNGCSKLSVMRSLLMIDEIDTTKQERHGGFDKGPNMQKEWLPVVDGSKLIDTSQGEIKISGMFRIFPGAYQEAQAHIDSLAKKEVLSKIQGCASQGLSSLENYMIKNSYNRDKDNFDSIENSLRYACRTLEDINLSFMDFMAKTLGNRNLVGYDLDSWKNYFNKFDFESRFKENFDLQKNLDSVSKSARNIREGILNNNKVDYYTIFDDIYYDFFENLCHFDRLDNQSYLCFIDLLSQIEKRKNSRTYVEQVGLGGELCRRNENGIFFLNTPRSTRTERILHKKLDKDLEQKLGFYDREIYHQFMSSHLNQISDYGYGYEYKKINDLAKEIKDSCVPGSDKYDPDNQFIGIEFNNYKLCIRPLKNENLKNGFLIKRCDDLIKDLNNKIFYKKSAFKNFKQGFKYIIDRFTKEQKQKLLESLDSINDNGNDDSDLNEKLISQIFEKSLGSFGGVKKINTLLLEIMKILNSKEVGLTVYQEYSNALQKCINHTELDENGESKKAYDSHALLFLFDRIKRDDVLKYAREEIDKLDVSQEGSQNEGQKIKYISNALTKYEKCIQSVDEDKKNLNEMKKYIYEITDLYDVKKSLIEYIKIFFDEESAKIGVDTSEEEFNKFVEMLRNKKLNCDESTRKKLYSRFAVFEYMLRLDSWIKINSASRL